MKETKTKHYSLYAENTIMVRELTYSAKTEETHEIPTDFFPNFTSGTLLQIVWRRMEEVHPKFVLPPKNI